MCRACHNASADSRVAITTRDGNGEELCNMLILNSFLLRFTRGLVIAILACTCLSAAAQTGAAREPLRMADDLQAAAQQAREQRVPLLLAFMLKTCPYCAAARRDYLEPMQADAQWRDKVIMLEIELDTPRALRGFDGTETTSRDFAKLHNIRSVPTIIVVDDRGNPATSPLIGLSSGDFYGLYLQQAIEAGLIAMRADAR